jgi:uncharacterized BrkB/YihY/UPF0761 family membrane protein
LLKLRKRALFAKFFADRGTHLAAMIAYFALLSFVPLTFLSLALLGLAGRADESSFLVTELRHAFPEAPVGDIVTLVRVFAMSLWAGIDVWRVPHAWSERKWRDVIKGIRRGEHQELDT